MVTRSSADATVRFLPPYAHDFNPIEPGWDLIKKRIRAVPPPHRSPCLRLTCDAPKTTAV